MSQRDLNIAAIAAVICWVGFCLYMGWLLVLAARLSAGLFRINCAI
jgi:hypothetical protein